MKKSRTASKPSKASLASKRVTQRHHCIGGCCLRVLREAGPLAFCGACFYLWQILAIEGCEDTAGLLLIHAQKARRSRRF